MCLRPKIEVLKICEITKPAMAAFKEEGSEDTNKLLNEVQKLLEIDKHYSRKKICYFHI